MPLVMGKGFGFLALEPSRGISKGLGVEEEPDSRVFGLVRDDFRTADSLMPFSNLDATSSNKSMPWVFADMVEAVCASSTALVRCL